MTESLKNPHLPAYFETSECVSTICYRGDGDKEWYPPLMIGAEAIAEHVLSSRQVERAVELLSQLEPDGYSDYMLGFYRAGLERFGEDWRYADIVTVAIGLSELLKPRNYLEVGVRRGRSVCAVAAQTPACDLHLFDMWISNYAGMDNPGPDLVRSELGKVGHSGETAFVDGDSHKTLPRYLGEHPSLMLDLITVDGDHSIEGATQDLCDVLPRLAIGGAIVFDDICHPGLPGLREVWRDVVASDPRFAAWSYDEIGYGVGFAVRKW